MTMLFVVSLACYKVCVSFLKEFITLKSYYFTLRKEERFNISNIEGKIFSVM